jgi:hypothetical protein
LGSAIFASQAIMKTRDVAIGFVFLVILIAGILWIFKAKNQRVSATPIPSPNIAAKIDKAFPNLNIPKGTERANLSDVSGGSSLGLATRTEIVANLPDPKAGEVYQGWLYNSEGKSVSLGNFRISKSGWILTYDSSKYPGYNKVVVTKGIYHILEGSF